jgi:hypothetical protein
MMNIESMIGQYALRTKPVAHSNGMEDHSYCEGQAVKIKKVTPTHIGIKITEGGMIHYLLRSIWEKDWVQIDDPYKDIYEERIKTPTQE